MHRGADSGLAHEDHVSCLLTADGQCCSARGVHHGPGRCRSFASGVLAAGFLTTLNGVDDYGRERRHGTWLVLACGSLALSLARVSTNQGQDNHSAWVW